MRKLILLAMLLVVLSRSILGQEENPTLRLITHDSFNLSEALLLQFEEESGFRVQILRSGDAGQMVNQAILSKNNPLGDVMFGIDNTFLSRALENDLFIAYESPLLETVAENFILDPEHRVTPIDYGDVCLNYDAAYFEERSLALPQSLIDLTKPDYRGLLVAQSPATSSPGLAFLLATIAEFGTTGDYTYLNFWEDLVQNETLITDGWESAYFGHFTAGSEDGTYPLVVSYASSPPFTADEAGENAAAGSITADGMCFRQVEFAGILAGTEQTEAAQLWIDFMLSVPVQEDIPLQMFVFPVNEAAKLPDLFVKFAVVPENPAALDPAEIEVNRQQWIEDWTEAVFR